MSNLKKLRCKRCGFIHGVDWTLVEAENYDDLNIEQDWYCPNCSEGGSVRVEIVEVQ